MFVGGVANHISKKLFEHSGDSPDFLKLEFDYDEPSLPRFLSIMRCQILREVVSGSIKSMSCH